MLMWLLCNWALAAAENWTALGSSDGWTSVATRQADIGPVNVWHRKIDGVSCLLGVAYTPVKPDKLIQVVTDIPASLRWSSQELNWSETLYNGGGTIHFWQYIDIPNWTLVSDRYWVLEGKVSRVDNGTRFRWTKLDGASQYPAVVEKARTADANAIEPPINWGEWLFLDRGDKTEVQYRACADVGGNIPTNVQQWIASRTLPDTIADVVREGARR